MEDLNPFIFVTVEGEDLLADQIEVEETPALVTQDSPTQCDLEENKKQKKKGRRKKKLKFTHIKNRHNAQSSNLLATQLPIKTQPININKKVDFVDVNTSSSNGTSVSNLSSDNNHSDFQIASVVSEAECIFNSENNDDSVSTSSSVNEDYEVLDPLQNECNLETIDKIPASDEKDVFNPLETDIKLFTPYIKKVCGNCKKVTDLKAGTLSNKKCNSCKHLITSYCCIICLEVTSLTDMYIHIFKCHYDKATSNNETQNKQSICSSHYANKEKLKEHESTCSVPANLFCKFCPLKMRLKREMREHMIKTHRQHFKMSELESMLDEIVHEADAVISLLTQHKGHCTTCNKQVPLTPPIQRRSTHCVTCSNKLVYYCSDVGSGCSSYPFTELSLLQLHLRYHANKGWTKKFNKQSSTTRVCHLCDYEDEPAKVKTHMISKHSDILLCKCDLCGMSLKNIRAWKRHQAKYCPVTHQKLQCGHCWFMCFRKRRLRKHLKSVHTHLYTGKRSQCKKCGITWAGLYRLRWHESRCSGDFKAERAKQKKLWAMRGVVTLS